MGVNNAMQHHTSTGVNNAMSTNLFSPSGSSSQEKQDKKGENAPTRDWTKLLRESSEQEYDFITGAPIEHPRSSKSDLLRRFAECEEKKSLYLPPANSEDEPTPDDEPSPAEAVRREDKEEPTDFDPIDVFGSLAPEPILRRDMLPPKIARFVFDTSERLGSTPALVAMAVLTVCAAALHDDIRDSTHPG